MRGPLGPAQEPHDRVPKASDYEISPFELESLLIEHLAVAVVVPAPDRVRIAVPKAYIALAPGHAPDKEAALSIPRHVRENMAPFQRVRRLEFVGLPKTISGKIRRVDLHRRDVAAPEGLSRSGVTTSSRSLRSS